MKNRSLRLLLILIVVGVVAVIATRGYLSRMALSEPSDQRIEGIVGDYFTLVDESANVLLETSFDVTVGDMFLDQDNRLHEVTSIKGFTAHTQLVRRLEPGREEPVFESGPGRQTAQGKQTGRVGVYNSHNDESYVPNRGTAAVKGLGGVVDVAESFARGLRDRGVEVIQSKRSHLPHDARAYDRSRRTARALLEQGVDALFDIHRDAVPAETCRAKVNGSTVTQVLLVVGRQNANMQAVDKFARGLKQVADSRYPNLVRGIFYARGNYNQDLLASSILLEFGSHESRRERAEESAVMFSDVATRYLYGAPNTAAGVNRTRTGGSAGFIRAIGWIVAAAVVGSAGYLLLATGGLREFTQKLKRFSTAEFANFLGRLRRKKGKD